MDTLHPSDIHDETIRNWYISQIEEQNRLLTGEYTVVSEKYPSIVEVESTSRCNINPPCPMCMRVNRTEASEFDIPEHLVNWMYNPINNAHRISISGIGEPMMSRSFDRMVEISGPKAAVSFFSNGHVINDKNIEVILGKPVAHIDFSLDAATAETYRKIRGDNDKTFGIVINNISKLIAARNARGLKSPTMHLIMVFMKCNYHELPDLVYLAHKLGVNGVRYWRMRAPSSPTDYKDHNRRDFHFSYKEQSELPDNSNLIIKEAQKIAQKYKLDFREN